MSRSLNVASALLFIIGVWLFIFGIYALFLPELHLSTSMTTLNEELRAADFSENLLGFMMYMDLWYGLYRMSFGLFFCVTSLMPYRRGERWAWYAMLVIGGINMLGTLVLTYIGLAASTAGINITMSILWIVGLALPAKEILSKPSS